LTQTEFAHPSEAEFASVLDFYQIPWQYEPRTFPLRYDESGRAVESFTPDFYLPEADLYIELTTLRQSLVTKKNRKLRRLRELYPEINIKLLYRRDFLSLARKFGLRTLEPVSTI
jgi:hypoxanthine phosphoribosyltransferase